MLQYRGYFGKSNETVESGASRRRKTLLGKSDVFFTFIALNFIYIAQKVGPSVGSTKRTGNLNMYSKKKNTRTIYFVAKF